MKWRLFNFDFGKKDKSQKAGEANRSESTAENTIRREWIPVEKLRVGMFVGKLDIPWEESSFLFQGVEIKTQDDINAVQNQCQRVWVDYPDTVQAAKPANDASFTNTESEEAEPVSVQQLQKEFKVAETLHKQTATVVSGLFENIATGNQIDTTQVHNYVKKSVDSVLGSQDAALWLIRLNQQSDQLTQHSMNVSALSIIMGNVIELPREALEELGISALMHDIGKVLLSNHLTERETLDDSEIEHLRTHVNIGYNIIAESLKSFSRAAKSVLHHHEYYDGTGYPNRLSGNDIPLYSRIIAIANEYDHLINGQSPVSQFLAIDTLYKRCRTHFDEELVVKFIEMIGLYPSGSLVEMTNGEVGIVLANGHHKLLPKVILVLDDAKLSMPLNVIDLSVLPNDQTGVPYQIKTSLADGTYGVFLRDFQRVGLKLN